MLCPLLSFQNAALLLSIPHSSSPTCARRRRRQPILRPRMLAIEATAASSESESFVGSSSCSPSSLAGEQQQDPDNNNKYPNLLRWLVDSGAEVNRKIEIRPSTRGGGYGAFVMESVEPDELLAFLPRDVCLTVDAAVEDDDCGKQFQKIIEQAGPGGNTVVLAGYVARAWLMVLEDLQRGKSLQDATYGPYLATLPWTRWTNSQEHVLFWTNEDFETYLKDSMCYGESKALREEVALAIRVLKGIVGPSILEYRGELKKKEEESAFKWPWEKKQPVDIGDVEGLPEAVTGAFVSILTRSFQDEDSENDNEKLVPLLDLLQHSDTPNVSHGKQESDGAVVIRARHALEAGEELLNQYRPELEETMPYHRFFTRYGFVPGIQEPMMNLLNDKSSIFYPQKAEV